MPVPTENMNSLSATMPSSVNDNCGVDLTTDNLHRSYHRDVDPSLLHFSAPNVQVYNENMIVVQVNPGETFTIQGEDGTYRSISGPAQVPMVSHNGAIPPIYVPPGYVSQVIEENGVRRVIVLPCGAGTDGQPSFMMSPSLHQPHPMHGLQQAHVHPGLLPQNMMPNCRPDEAIHFVPQPMYIPDEMSLSDLSDSSLSSVHQCSDSTTPSGAQNGSSSRTHLLGSNEQLSNVLQSHHNKPLPASDDSTTLPTSSMNSSSASASFASPRGSPKSLKNSLHTSECKIPNPPIRLVAETSPMSLDDSGHVTNASKLNSDFEEQDPLTTSPPGSDDENPLLDVNDEQSSPDAQPFQTILELLSSLKPPKIRDLNPRSAKVVWVPLPVQRVNQELKLKTREFSVFYDLHFSRCKKDNGKFHSIFSGKECKYTITDLRPASDYDVRLFATCNDERGPASGITSFRTPSCPPDVPLAPKLQSRTKNSLLLKWTAPNENGEKIQKYHLEMNEAENGSGFRLVSSTGQKQFKVQKLVPSCAYLFRLAAENKLGKSNWSANVCFYTSGTAPSPPEAPRLTKASIKTLTLAWTKPQGEVAGYTLEMNDESTGYGFRPVYDGSDLKFLVKNLARSSHYKFRLLAYNNEGKSKYSEVTSYLTCPDKPRPPGKPHVQGNMHSRSFKLSWESPPDTGGAPVNEYILEMSKEKGGAMEVVYTGPDQECLVEGLEPGHSYRLRVFCLTNGGSSMPSEVLQVTTNPVLPGPCNHPTLAMRPKPTCLFIKWAPPPYTGGSPIDGYELDYIATSELDQSTPSQAFKGPGLECNVGTLRPGTKYSFAVRASNKVGFGPWSDRLEAVTSAGPPEKPVVPQASVLSPSSIQLQWTAPECNGAEITHYLLQWGGTEEAMSSHMTGPVLIHELQCLNPNTTYYYSVQAVNSAGQSPSSEVGYVTTPPSCPNAVENLRLYDVIDDVDDDETAMFTTTASQIAVQWDKPNDHGSEITGYKIHVTGKKASENNSELFEVDGSLSHHCILDREPDTEYNIKVCATNSIGSGCFSRSLRVKTKPLPPDAPELTCVQTTSSSLKLQWHDRSKFTEGTNFLLQMRDKHGRFFTAYRGSNPSYKVTRLNENTTHRFRINATNSEGVGPFSQEYAFHTRPQLPPILEAPTISSVQTTSCHVTWQKIDSIKGDAVHYTLNLGKPSDPSFSVILPCESTSYNLNKLASCTTYSARVAAVRRSTSARFPQSLRDDSSTCSEVTDDGSEVDLSGPLSNCVTFSTLSSDYDDTDVVENPTLSYLHLAASTAAKVHTSAPEHSVAGKEAPSSREEPEEDSDPKASWLTENMTAVLVAFYFLSAILIAFSLQFIYVK